MSELSHCSFRFLSSWWFQFQNELLSSERSEIENHHDFENNHDFSFSYIDIGKHDPLESCTWCFVRFSKQNALSHYDISKQTGKFVCSFELFQRVWNFIYVIYVMWYMWLCSHSFISHFTVNYMIIQRYPMSTNEWLWLVLLTYRIPIICIYEMLINCRCDITSMYFVNAPIDYFKDFTRRFR